MLSSGGMMDEPQSHHHPNSVHCLTLEELLNQPGDAGKSLSGINMDELLRNIWTVEESRALAMAIANWTSSVSPPSLNRPAALALPATLSRKTVDEVWTNMQRNRLFNEEETIQQRQKPFGEMTLGFFLGKPGAIREDNKATVPTGSIGHYVPNAEAMVTATQTLHRGEWRQYQFDTVPQPPPPPPPAATDVYDMNPAIQATLHNTLAIPGGPAAELLGEYRLSPCPIVMSPDSPCRKRPPESVIENTVERQQKRMIKNRESAARSRARKQAYTTELESEVTQLKEENARLKQQQLLEKITLSTFHRQSNYILRRTSTAPF